VNNTKVTVRVYDKLMDSFNRQADELYLKRDAFLNHIIRRETPLLAADLKGKRLSPPARKHIARSLKRLGTTTVNLVVEKATAEALNKVVEETNMVRDAFINRLIVFLRSSTYLMKFLDLPEFITRSGFKSGIEHMPTSPMKAIEAVHGDPFYYLRTAIQQRYETGLYLIHFSPKLVGFECYLEDEYVPGTPSYEEEQKKADEVFRELDSFESDAFAKPAGAGQ